MDWQKRKSRGRGLRATTGCLICRRRHVKCDEARPQCGPCAKGQRACVYALRRSLRDVAGPGTPDSLPSDQLGPKSQIKASTESPVTSRAAPLRWFQPSATDATTGEEVRNGNVLQRDSEIESPPLSDVEHHLFRHFVRVSSKLLDFHDPEIHFATTVPHMALRNLGLMKALLGLSARHLSLGPATTELDGREYIIDRNLAVQYYLDALDYLNTASYPHSLDLVATAILISTYEMIDGSNRNWERHLKAVYWMQQSQANDGESGGLRSAIWWAWLQQDIWVAMQERRRVLNVWNPTKPVSTLKPPELARRAIYLLSQCVNYASKEEEQSDLTSRLDKGGELLFLLQQWHDNLPPEYRPLTCCSSDDAVFPPIWVNPPSYAAALQMHSLAMILVIVHRPSAGGIENYRAAQQMLAGALGTICGIARSVDEDDDAANMISLHCLFRAGICVQTLRERLVLLDLLDLCQQRLHWPLISLRKELELEYAKDTFSGPST
ncbi:hypothetical protein AWENTII_002103 [Aspergillus wentii]